MHSRGVLHMYSDLAPWFHLLTHPSDYEDEAAFVSRVVDDVGDGESRTLLELGSGGGNNASHLEARFACTLTDLSPEMLALRRSIPHVPIRPETASGDSTEGSGRVAPSGATS